MTKDLTEGSVPPLLVKFTIPIVLGNLFQMAYNAADSAIVGRFVGKEALAAVGICNPVMTLMILIMNGLCMGAAILMGNQYGAKEYDVLKREISTTGIAGIIFSCSLSVICILFAPLILGIMQVEESILSLTVEYMRIIFLGLIFTYLYNFFSSTLRALGDSRTPLYFLMFSACLNVVGDLFFVVVLHMGSKGCAVSTVVSEAISALFCIIYIQRSVPMLRLGKGWLTFDRSLFGKTVSYGWASAMQQGTVQLGKICMQSIVNTMGVSVAAAFAVVNRLDDFAYTPQQNIGHSMTALMAQNLGAGRKDRMEEGFRWGLILEGIYSVCLFIVFHTFAKNLMGAFSTDQEVIGHGVKYLKLIAFMYIVPGLTNGVQGYFRGIGDLKVTLLASFTNMGTRILAALPMVFLLHMGIEALPFSYLFGWACMLLVELPLLLKTRKTVGKKAGKSEESE